MFSVTLRSCRQSATDLLDALRPVIPRLVEAGSSLHTFEIYQIQSRARDFKIALLAEMGVLPSYFVTQKGGFDTSALLDRAASLFPTELAIKVPEATFDVAEAGKALAFELGTAAGFHLFRVVEAVIRRYYSETTKGSSHPRVRSIKVYIRAMEKAGVGDTAILRALEQLADFHRNPLIHPEAALSLDEAISILGMARSVATAMLNRLPTPPQTTSSPLAVP